MRFHFKHNHTQNLQTNCKLKGAANMTSKIEYNSKANIDKSMAAIRSQITADIARAEHKDGRIILAITDAALLFIAMTAIYMCGIGNIPFLACITIVPALALCSYWNHSDHEQSNN